VTNDFLYYRAECERECDQSKDAGFDMRKAEQQEPVFSISNGSLFGAAEKS
jgi:hypothetical protein